MGNLCSSGAERAEKKDDNQLPDKPRDGEDEALLPKGEAAVEVKCDGVQVSAGVDGGGLGEALSSVVSQGKSTLSDASGSIDAESQQLAAQSQSAFTRVVQSGKDGIDKGAQDVKSNAVSAASDVAASGKAAAEAVVEETVTSAKAAAQDAAAKGAELVRENVEQVVQQVSEKASSVVDSASSRISNATEAAMGGILSTKDEAARDGQSVNAAVTESSTQIVSEADSAVSKVENISEEAKSEAKSLNTDASSFVRNSLDAGTEQAFAVQSNTEKSLQEDILDKFEELKSSTLNTVENFQQTSKEKVGEAVDSIQQTSSQAVEEISHELKQEAESVSERIVGVTQNTESEVKQIAVGEIDNVESASGTLQDNIDSLAAETATNAESVFSEKQQILKDEASQAASKVVDATVSTSEDIEKETTQIVRDAAQEFTEADAALTTRNSGLVDSVSATVSNTLQSAVELVQEKAVENFQAETNDAGCDAGKDVLSSEEPQENDRASFLEKAKSLLDAHRNSLDESKTVNLESAEDVVNDVEQIEEAARNVVEDVVKSAEGAVQAPEHPEGEESSQVVSEATNAAQQVVSEATDAAQQVVSEATDAAQQVVSEATDAPQQVVSEATDAAQEATAREFVESIIDKATSLVAESFNKGDEEDESSTASEVSVERGEETMEPKKRGVMFISPQLSEQSSLPLSSPPEFSPPLEFSPPPVMDDITPPSDETNSSLSQNDSTEKEELFSSPQSAPIISFNVNENNNNHNVLNNNAEEDDESFQRVAMEVTTKAVQDAIKIVTQNGTGSLLNNPALSNDLGISSPSSPENEEDEMTTTDSSQVERGSPVSDITDTSAQGSVSESLSSYDPGAVFRQDVANLSDLITSPIDVSPSESTSASADFPGAPSNAQVVNDLINFDDCTSSQANTPTNAALVDGDNSQPANEEQTKPTAYVSSEVPSSLSFDDDVAMPGKPTIVINSPDSAHHTNGSAEDLTTSQSEALI